jgi:SAM-dependent methyltransferase
MAARTYFMEDAREATRLAAKVNAEEWVAKYLRQHLPRNGRVLESRVLEIGCGPGVLLRAAAMQEATLSVTGVDLSPARVQEAKERNTDLPRFHILRGDAAALDLPSDSFDLVYSRFLLEYLPCKEQAVREMVRVCRPGGTVLLQDLDGQLIWHYPEDEELESQVHCVLRLLAETGFDPFVGRSLFWLAKRAGLDKIQVQAESYHLVAGPIDPTNRSLWELKLDIARPMVAQALGSEKAAAEVVQRFLEYLDRADTLTYSILFTVAARKPV